MKKVLIAGLLLAILLSGCVEERSYFVSKDLNLFDVNANLEDLNNVVGVPGVNNVIKFIDGEWRPAVDVGEADTWISQAILDANIATIYPGLYSAIDGNINNVVPYTGATSHIDLNDKNVTTTGKIESREFVVTNPYTNPGRFYLDNSTTSNILDAGTLGGTIKGFTTIQDVTTITGINTIGAINVALTGYVHWNTYAQSIEEASDILKFANTNVAGFKFNQNVVMDKDANAANIGVSGYYFGDGSKLTNITGDGWITQEILDANINLVYPTIYSAIDGNATDGNYSTLQTDLFFVGDDKLVITPDGNIETTGTITTPTIQNVVANETMSINPNSTGDLSGDAPAYTTDIGLKIFENADTYIAHNNAGNANPQLAFYGGSSAGQKYGTIGMDDYGRLVFGGTATNTVFSTNLYVGGELRMSNNNNGYIAKNTASVLAGTDHITYGGNNNASTEPVWVFTDWVRRALNFGVTDLATPQLWIHDGSATADNHLKIYHDGTDGIINSNAGDLKLSSANNEVVVDGNITATGTGTFKDLNVIGSVSFIKPIVKYHRVQTLDTSGTGWDAIAWDLNIPEESTEDFYLIDNNQGINIKKEGVYKINGCIHSKYNGVSSADVKLAVRVLYNGVEARCLQASRTKTKKQNDVDTLEYTGTIYATVDTNVTVQYKVDNTDLDLEGDTIFDRPVSASINFEWMSRKTT